MDEMENQGGEREGPARPKICHRACDPCRIRKIGCNRGWPCSNCETARLECTRSPLGQKQTEVKQRVLISRQYERKIDDIVENVRQIEQHLARLGLNSPPPLSSAPASRHGSSSAIAHSTPANAGDVSASASEGEDLSQAAQSVLANDFLERAVEAGGMRELGRGTSDALESLRQIVRMRDQPASSRELAFPCATVQGSDAGQKLPPLDVALTVLRWAKGGYLSTVQWLADLLPIETLTAICQKIYVGVDGYSEIEFCLANGCLYSLMVEYGVHMTDENETNQWLEHTTRYQENFQISISRLPLCLPPTIEAVAALTMGAYHASDISKPTFAWYLLSTASQLAQTLGFHRLASMRRDDEATKEAKIRLFWSIYILDKALSLRLGRASVIRESDISIPETFSDSRWIKTSRIQGNIYECLYSHAALSRPEPARLADAQNLVAELHGALAELQEIKKNFKADSRNRLVHSHFLMSEEVLLYSLLTLVQRAIPPPPGSQTSFTPSCISAARTTLGLHQSYFELIRPCNSFLVSMYINLAITYAPFAPFMVIFCHVTESLDPDDLKSLYNFVVSLQDPASALEPVAKLHRLCSLLYDVARLYVEAKQGPKQTKQAATSDEFDMYLTKLGFAPWGAAPSGFGDSSLQPEPSVAPDWNAGSALFDTGACHVMNGGNAVFAQRSQLENWFNGSQHMMDLMGDDTPF